MLVLETEVTLQRMRGRGDSHCLSHCEGQIRNWRGDGEGCLLLVTKFEEVKFQEEIRRCGM